MILSMSQFTTGGLNHVFGVIAFLVLKTAIKPTIVPYLDYFRPWFNHGSTMVNEQWSNYHGSTMV